jgi:DNA-3-methyladenine glycosylase
MYPATVRGLPDLSQPAPIVAPQLIGCELVAHGVRGRIVETEAYQGEADKASHAAQGRTARADVLYRRPGTVYLYLVYGLHVMLNLVCDREGAPAAVLIRALEILDGEAVVRRRRRQPSGGARLLANGPGKVCEALALDLSANGKMLGRRGCPLRLLPPTRPPEALTVGPRVGVAYAGPGWADRPWRWWEAGFPVAGARATAC